MLSIFICFLSTLPFLGLLQVPTDKIYHYTFSFLITYFLFFIYNFLNQKNKTLFFFIVIVLLFIPISITKEYIDSLAYNNYFDYYDIIANYLGCFSLFLFYFLLKVLKK